MQRGGSVDCGRPQSVRLEHSRQQGSRLLRSIRAFKQGLQIYFASRSTDSYGMINRISPPQRFNPVQIVGARDQANVFGKSVNQPEGLGEAGAAFENHLVTLPLPPSDMPDRVLKRSRT